MVGFNGRKTLVLDLWRISPLCPTFGYDTLNYSAKAKKNIDVLWGYHIFGLRIENCDQ